MSRLSLAGVVARLGLVAAVLSLAAVGPVQAQGVSARVEGVITDAQGGAIPGATVVATNVGTNQSREAQSDPEGRFLITPLQPGSYSIKVELTGFKAKTTKATLTVNQVARFDFTLEVGGVEEVVEVTGVAPLIEKTTSALGTVIDAEQVANLPLNGRNFTQLITLAPGVNRGVPGGVASGESGNTETFRYSEVGGGAVSVNGVREQGNSYYYDGIDNNERLVNSLVFFPSPDALQEFRTITANAPAEFGRAGGAITNLISKSGTNEFHGSAYYYGRPEWAASTPEFASEKPDFNRHQFGATFGGPLVKDKTFFFLNYAGLHQVVPVEVGNFVTVPTSRMRNGDFSELLNPAFTGLGGPVTIYDPVTGLPFPGNIIPAGRLDPVGRALLNAYPMPELTDRLMRNYEVKRQNEGDFNDADLRLDHRLTDSDNLFFRGSFSDSKKFDPGRIPGYQAGFGSGGAVARAYSGALGYSKIFSPTVVNEARLGFVHLRYAYEPVNYGTNQNAELGIPGAVGYNSPYGISLIGGGDGRYLEYLGDYGPYEVVQRTYQLSDSVSWIKGKHAFKFGGNFLIADLDSTRQDAGKGFYSYSDFVATPGNLPGIGYTGYEVADILVGVTAGVGRPADASYATAKTRAYEMSFFVQDDWRVSSKLTLNLGLRYDVFTPYFEKDDKMSNYDPTTDSLVLPGQDGAPRSTVDTDYNNFGPRVGFAYQVADRTVLRGSYGVFYGVDRGGIDNQLTENNRVVAYNGWDGGATGPNHVRISQPISLAPTRDPNNPTAAGQVKYVPRDSETPMYQQFNVGLERELTNTMAVSVFYVGTRGDKLLAQTSNGSIRTSSYIAESSYNSLQVSARRTATDFSFLAAYTLGHAKNNSPGPFPGPGGVVVPTIMDDLGVDDGNADFDVRHRFTFAATYALPFAKDNRLLGGWSVNGIVTLQTGNYFSVFSNNTRADLVSGQDPNDGPKTEAEWFNTGAFTTPGAGTGRSGRNIVQGPGFKSIDMSLFKSFKVKGSSALELRAEVFNLLDTVQYGIPNQSVGDVNFGRITSTRQNSERQFQFSARFTF